jgi:hypothetical protein
MFYTSLSLSSSPLHLLGDDDIPTCRKVHQVVMQPIRSQKLRNASGGDAGGGDHKIPGEVVMQVM